MERALAPTISTGLRHALLTAMAALVTTGVSVVVYVVMRRQQRQLADTARKLTRLLEAYQQDPRSAGRFENPYVSAAESGVRCLHTGEFVPTTPKERCWQVMALRHPAGSGPALGAGVNASDQAPPTLQQCQACPVYREACPEELTELGEGINNLLYLLEAGAGEIGRMRDQVLEKQKMAAVGQVAAGVAHEICNPLSSISSVVQLLQRQRDLAGHGEQFAVIERHIQRISRIVRQLVDLTGPPAQNWEYVDVRDLLEEMPDAISVLPQAQGVLVKYARPASLPVTWGCRAHLRQMLLNLALNAVDAMPAGGTLTLGAREQDGRLVLTIADTGDGIASDVGRRVFEPFYTTKEPGRGTGLGLTVTYSIIQEHGGTIDYDTQPGAGTTFTVTLPILAAPMGKQHDANHRLAGRR